MTQEYLFEPMYLRTCFMLLKSVGPYRSLKKGNLPGKCTVLVPLKMWVTLYITDEKYKPLYWKIWRSTHIRNHINALEGQHSSLDSHKDSRALHIFRKYPSIYRAIPMLQIYAHTPHNNILILFSRHELGVRSSKSWWTRKISHPVKEYN